MQIKGAYTFQAPRPAVWEALMDPTVLAQALPGGEKLEQVGENEYKAAMNVRVGPVQGKFDGKVELSAIEPPERYRMKVNGSGPAGFVDGEGAISLSENGDGTVMSYEGNVQVGGKIAGVGQRLIDSTAKSIIRQGLKVLDEQIQARLAPPAPAVVELEKPPVAETPAPAPAVAPAVPAPSPQPQAAPAPSAAKLATEVAKDVARDLASDYIPLNQQEKVFYAVLGALGMLLFVILVRLVQSRD
ncbi:MAG: carbon monoxide dehydrogenase [Chloroflexi bacterium]|nr:MAG: carbon monoxide dehydrogenase [Chloroflexota bacterium]